MSWLLAVLAALSIWDYPGRHFQHVQLRNQFVTAVREGDTPTMIETCRKGIELLPDDPTWHYNLACSLAYNEKKGPALDELEKAIDLGFRKPEVIAEDNDLKQMAGERRFLELIEYAKLMRERPMLLGPMANVPATGIFGKSIVLGEQNLIWNFDFGCFEANMILAVGDSGGNTGDLYMNRDGNHSTLSPEEFPGLTFVRFDKEGRDRTLDRGVPNTLFPYPIFGNSSTAYQGHFWRSNGRALMSNQSNRLNTMVKFYLSNQVWLYPSAGDTPPVGTNGDVYASITPYWINTAGRSWSDLPYLKAALLASRSLRPETKKEAIRRNLFAPTIITLLRRALKGVDGEADYLSPKAHPSAFPPNGLDTEKLVKLASSLTETEIQPLAVIAVETPKVEVKSPWPEATYATGFAWAYVLRSDLEERKFTITAQGAKEFRFFQSHGEGIDVKIKQPASNVAEVTLNRKGMSPTNRVDIAIVGRNPGTDWGAPSYVSFARMDPLAPYSDPVLTILPDPETK